MTKAEDIEVALLSMAVCIVQQDALEIINGNADPDVRVKSISNNW